MLDVHPPHESAHTWRDFFIHIATIVVGLLIAVGLEQTVELFHHRHQAHHAEQALIEEGLQNRALVQRDLPSIAEAQRLIRANMAALDRAASPTGTPFHPVAYLAPTYVLTPHDVEWLALRDNNLLSIVPPALTTAYWEIDYDRTIAQEGTAQIIQRRQKVESLLHLHDDPSTLSVEERERLLLAFSALDQALANMRTALLIYNASNEAALSGKPFDPNSVFHQAGIGP
jgi:hypothetical protein